MQQSFLYFPSHLSPALDQGGFCGGQVWGPYLPFRPRPVIHVRGTGDPGECLECSSVPLLRVGQAASCPSPSHLSLKLCIRVSHGAQMFIQLRHSKWNFLIFWSVYRNSTAKLKAVPCTKHRFLPISCKAGVLGRLGQESALPPRSLRTVRATGQPDPRGGGGFTSSRACGVYGTCALQAGPNVWLMRQE